MYYVIVRSPEEGSNWLRPRLQRPTTDGRHLVARWSSFAVREEHSGAVSSLQAARAVELRLGRLFDASSFFTMKETVLNKNEFIHKDLSIRRIQSFRPNELLMSGLIYFVCLHDAMRSVYCILRCCLVFSVHIVLLSDGTMMWCSRTVLNLNPRTKWGLTIIIVSSCTSRLLLSLNRKRISLTTQSVQSFIVNSWTNMSNKLLLNHSYQTHTLCLLLSCNKVNNITSQAQSLNLQ